MGCTAALMVISLYYVQTFDTALANQYSIKPFMNRVVSVVKDAPLFFYNSEDNSVMFYAGRHIHRYQPPLKTVSSPFYILFWENDWRAIRESNGLSVRATSQSIDRENPERGHLLLVEVKNVDALPSGAKSARNSAGARHSEQGSRFQVRAPRNPELRRISHKGWKDPSLRSGFEH